MVPMKRLAPLVVIAPLRLTLAGVLIVRELFAPPKLRAPVVMLLVAESAIAPPLEFNELKLVSMLAPFKLIAPPDVVTSPESAIAPSLLKLTFPPDVEMGELAVI